MRRDLRSGERGCGPEGGVGVGGDIRQVGRVAARGARGEGGNRGRLRGARWQLAGYGSTVRRTRTAARLAVPRWLPRRLKFFPFLLICHGCLASSNL